MIEHQSFLRLGCFLAVFILVALAESVAPRRVRAAPRVGRWVGNFAVLAVGTVLVRLVVPMAPVSLALLAAENGWGLFNAVAVPRIAAFALSVALLDLLIYAQHVVFHAVPLLWRLHRMHHSDIDLDASSAIRFHPLEFLLSMGVKLGAVAVLGPPPEAVLAFELLLNGTAMFNHANLRLPAGLDPLLRLVVVTPDMHRVHHSIEAFETNSNYGFCLPWWDRLFGTYRAQPEGGHQGMVLGLRVFREPQDSQPTRLLIQPFR